jgi:hypothetical protein
MPLPDQLCATSVPAPGIPLRMCTGGLLKEAVDDLEWAAAGGHQSARGNVHLLIRSQPRAVVMRASGAGALEVGPCDKRLLGCPAGRTTHKWAQLGNVCWLLPPLPAPGQTTLGRSTHREQR